MQLPQTVRFLLQQLQMHGYSAYVVGGCVRDVLLGLTPHDWDICTSALPQEVISVFSEQRVVPTGFVHGTVTVILDGEPFEITTFRTESQYTDHRHPQNVEFVATIQEDLSRRDFTINAVAYHPDVGFIDPFGGIEDAKAGILCCVGNPITRFEEDALRILRALRFAAVYDLEIEEKTREAIILCSSTLPSIAAERVQSELKRMLTGNAIGRVLQNLHPVLFEIIPELKSAKNVNQHSVYHCYDVLQHILKTVEYAPNDLTVRLAALLHDIGKPFCFTMDDDGNGHFFGHARIGVDMAHKILTCLRFDKRTIEEVSLLIQYHDTPLEKSDACVKRWLNRMGEELLRKLLRLKQADCLAHDPTCIQTRLEEIADIEGRLDRVLQEQACFSLHDLAVNGNDLLALGIPSGKAVGNALQYLLDEVVEQRLDNEKTLLLQALRKRLDYFIKNR